MNRSLCSVSFWISAIIAPTSLLFFIGCGGSENESRTEFVGFSDFSRFAQYENGNSQEIILLSPEITTSIPWNELIVSWNTGAPPGTYLKFEARAIFSERSTEFYTMGLWSEDTNQFPRESVEGQVDSDGVVWTDTLRLNALSYKAQLRITLASSGGNTKNNLKFLGVSFSNTKLRMSSQASRLTAGHELKVIERSQNVYPRGSVLCSPTSMSMVLHYWSEQLNRPELDLDVPVIAEAVYDPVLDGTGNWSFNTAFAGQFPGMRAYVTRLNNLTEVEEWTARGVPVVLSVQWHLLKSGRRSSQSGHLVVCTGFTPEGDVIIHDPKTQPGNTRVRQIYKRKNVAKAWWSKSRNAVYLIYPESLNFQEERFVH